MGIVFKQSLRNTIVTYVGFGIGAVNTLFLYTNFLTEAYFGLVGVILSTAAILMPLMAFGVPNTMVRYYSRYSDKGSRANFLNLMLFLPLLLILPIAALSYVFQELISNFLSRKNEIVGNYVWYIFLIGLAMAYFEVFFAWSKVQLKSVFGNFMKEVFARVCVSAGLLMVFFDILTVDGFLIYLVAIYMLRTVIMKLYAYSLHMPSFSFKFPAETKEIMNYSTLIILGGSVAVLLLEIDRFMINQFIAIENVAYYTVSIFIATVIAVPARAMHQITYPMTAELMNSGALGELKQLYQKSSLTLFIVSGLVFLLVVLNLSDLDELLPVSYRGGIIVVTYIGLAKVFDALLGNNSSILYNSRYYKGLLLLGIFLAVLTILLNIWLIPVFGIEGAAIASFSAIAVYNCAKLIYVKATFKMHPFTAATFKVFCLLLLVGVLFYFFSFDFHPVVNIVLKSALMSLFYFGILYRLKISEEIFEVLQRWLKR